jgi:protein-tyrosine-phosphatase/tRNA A37 threonylcarbamoyladenosine synthetase subunit TsaC/SUA5/YrdC
MTKILDWKKSDDPRDVVHLAVQALAEGHIVALPSSSSYILVASGLKHVSIETLASFNQPTSMGLCLLIRSPDETLDYFPNVSPAARRLGRKAWPGPVALSLSDSHPSSLFRCLDSRTTALLSDSNGRIRVWQPQHEVLDYVCKLASGPLIGCLANSGTELFSGCLNETDQSQSVLAIDDGPVESPGEPTVIQIDGNQGQIVRQGILTPEALKGMSQFMVLFVCTGNTCRSPMAQAIMQKKIIERLQNTDKGTDGSVIALSAGVSAFGGDPASHGAATAIRNFGANLDRHQSTQLNSYLVEQADIILAMGNRHRQVIVSQWPNAAHKVHLISPDGGEINDPFGGPVEVYQRCAQQLDQHTSYWIDQLNLDALVQWVDSSKAESQS